VVECESWRERVPEARPVARLVARPEPRFDRLALALPLLLVLLEELLVLLEDFDFVAMLFATAIGVPEARMLAGAP
jgi:hypothetical protein